jgi:branched-chain amino acid transport system substrate-binding protein
VSGRLLAALACALLLVSACGTELGKAKPNGFRGTARIALVNVFSGPSGYLGEYVQNSIQAQVDSINAGGGLLGYRLEVIAADDEQKPDKGAELVREQLAEGDVKLLVGPSSTSVAVASMAAINAARVPNCTLDLSSEALSGAPFTFRIQEQDRYRVAALLGYVLRSRSDIKRVGLFGDGDPSSQVYERELQDQAPRFGLQYVGRVVGKDASDQSGLVTAMLRNGAQAAMLPRNAATATRLVQAVSQLGVGNQLQLLGSSDLGSYSFAQGAGEAANGLVFESTIQSYLTDVPDSRWPPLYRSFTKKVTSQYGYASNGVEMKALPAAADCIVEWSRALKAAGTLDGTAVARAWEGLDLAPDQTVLGAHEKLGPGSHDGLAQDGIFVYQWTREGDRWRLKQLTGPRL